jgi:DNA invertase Pin-like site-specific DNA recombinase
MATVGYARVSTTGQSLDVQLDMLKQAGCTKVFQEKRSGRDGKRPELARCIEYVREGDVLLVTKPDRLARSTSDLYGIIGKLKEKGVGFRCVDNTELDTTTKHGKLLLGVLAIIAEFEADIRHERQMEGIAKAKERGVAFGRQPKLTDEQVRELRQRRDQGILIKELMAAYGLSKASVYRLLDDGSQSRT